MVKLQVQSGRDHLMSRLGFVASREWVGGFTLVESKDAFGKKAELRRQLTGMYWTA